jgi:predicted site-specific integrase-resolvase
VVGILFDAGTKVSESTNEEAFGKTAEGNCPQCREGAMGQVGQTKGLKAKSWRGWNMGRVKRAAIYARVSTPEQETDLQEHELREYVESRGWSCVVYRDKGQSGAKKDRPALTTLINDLRHRKIDVVVVWALDRLARSLKQLLSR